MKRSILFIFFQLFIFSLFAQTAKPKLKGWHLLNYQQDGYMGTGVKEAYDLLKGRKSSQVIVAVIDSGIDTTHEDLVPHLWVNEKEIPGNGIDDDKNGYVDDVRGWNFDGAPNGENLATNTLEISRMYHNWKAEFENKTIKDIPTDRKFLFGQWLRAKKILDKQYEDYKSNIENAEQTYTVLNATSTLLIKYLNKPDFKKADIMQISSQDSLGWSASVWIDIFRRSEDIEIKNTAVLSEVDAYRNNLLNEKKRKEDLPVDIRGNLIKDDYTNINDSIYGNNNLKTGSGNHGTHVSGIIGAVRNNGIGVDGIVDNVRIMAIRAVPGGDEHDKDVALAIRYAVDNGALVINMSFGKPVSPYKKFVDDAVKYAASRNVLIIHGAGNDGENLDENPFYPNPVFIDSTVATNMLTIGASGDYSTGKLIADFSNYSSKAVDIFAPGVYINSTITNNGYEPYDGTSMASPVAAGVAALIRSYFPKLTPKQVIDLIMRTGTKIKEPVNIPGNDTEKTTLDKLCKSGSIINAYEAVKLALKLYK